MHTQPMPDSAGDFSKDEPTDHKCKHCGGEVRCSKWESSCGGYEDYRYKCIKCGHGWWVDGIDS